MKSRASTIFLIVAFIIAVLLGGGLFYLLQGTDFSFLSDSASAPHDMAVPAKESDIPEVSVEPTKPSEYVISMIGDCTLASSQYTNDFEDQIAKNGRGPSRVPRLILKQMSLLWQIWSAVFRIKPFPLPPCSISSDLPQTQEFSHREPLTV